MDNAIANITPLQAFLSLAFTVWMIIFPIIIIRKIDYLTALIDSKDNNDEISSENEDHEERDN